LSEGVGTDGYAGGQESLADVLLERPVPPRSAPPSNAGLSSPSGERPGGRLAPEPNATPGAYEFGSRIVNALDAP
jgi:hypothetical protein